MAEYIYNPLLKEGFQKKQDIPTPPPPTTVDDELSPTSTNPVQNKVITAKLEEIEQDTRKKVTKFFSSIEELEVGETGQYQGETNDEFTHDFFYERGEATPSQYEDITIPSGAKKIVYTNKFDNSQRVVYEVETVTLDHAVTTQFQQHGYVSVIDAAFKSRLYSKQMYENIFQNYSIIPHTSGLFYSLQRSLRDLSNELGADVVTTLQQLYEILQDVEIIAGFRTSTATPGVYGRVVDVYAQVLLPICEYNQSGVKDQTSTQSIYVLASELAAVNWDISQIAPLYNFPNDQQPNRWVVDTDRLDNYYIEYWGDIIQDEAGNLYAMSEDGSTGQGAGSMYRTISADGKQNRYIDINHLSCVFNGQPISTSDYWAQNIDLQLYFDYNVSWETTTEAITIHRKIQQYDEYGFPIADVATAIRRDTQPSLNPSDFATSEQGVKADTALQGIAKGTDGNYITTTVGVKDSNRQQTVGSSLKIQDIATADSTHKGLAEASSVKAYAATAAQGAKADTALQSIDKGTDGDYITTTVTAKDANKQQKVGASLTIQDIASTDNDHRGLLEALNTRNYIDNEIYKISLNFFFYGVQWDENDPSPDCTRIGNMSLHAELPVQNAIIGGLLQDDLTFTPFADQSDWSGETVDGSAGQLMLQIPKHYFKSEINGTIHKKLISQYPLAGFIEIPMMYVSAEKATVDRTDPNTPKLCSVVNTSPEFRGGQNIADWDNTYRTLLGKPAANISLTNFRQYARNRGNGTAWNCHIYLAQRVLYWLFVTEYATLNSQKAFNAAKDANGYMQGGLGPGVSDWNGDAWLAYNNYNPLIPCGYMLEYGNQSAVKNYNVLDADGNILHTFSVNSYRGVQSPFADIWDWVDGILINVQSDAAGGVSTCYITDDPAKFSSSDFSQYTELSNTPRADSWIKTIFDDKQGNIICKTEGGSSTSYYCDFYWGTELPATGVSLRGVLFGGRATNGSLCGFLYASSHYGPGYVHPFIGSRLCAIPPP